jgi:hypothetical protein
MRPTDVLLRTPYLALAALLATAACSSASAPAPGAFPAEAFQSFSTDKSQLQIELRMSPQPPVEGLNSAEYTVTDATTQAPVDGLTVSLVPWMPAMGHGTSIVPTLTPMGNGVYLFTDLSLFMAGEWQLRTQFSGLSGQVSDSAAPTFSVP